MARSVASCLRLAILLPLPALLALPGGCATGKAGAAAVSAAAGPSAETLRSQNSAYARRIAELENQVFILNGELEARRAGEPPLPAAAAPPPTLPEVKLARGQSPPQAEDQPAESRPESVVAEAPIEYVGAATERSTKRPLLRLWGPDAEEAAAAEEAATSPPAAPRRDPGPRRDAGSSPPRAAAAPARAVMPPPATEARGEEQGPGLALYNAGLEQLRTGRHVEAVENLRAFVRQHPQHDMADNAQYWLGECFYDRKDYSTALREFRRVAEKFPQGNKVPDALLKAAFSYLALGSQRPARETLQEIVQSYPRHPAAALARAKLGELDGATTMSTTAAAGEKEIR